MSREIRADYTQQFLFPPSLEDLVPAGHPARFLREVVDSLDLEALGFRQRESEVGRPSYAPDLLLKVWLYGYLFKIRSSRQLERACHEHLSLLWLTGLHPPDHNTLWRFWHHEQEGLRAVFGSVLKLAVQQGLVGMVLHTVDGTKIQARSSRRSGQHKKQLRRLLRKLGPFLEETEREIEDAEARESGDYRLPEELEDPEALRKAVQEGLEELEKEGREHRHPGEPDAEMMRCGRTVEFAYNAQAAVDRDSGLIVAQDVVTAAADAHELVPMLEQVEERLGAVATETVTDGGYFSGQTLEEADQRGYSVVLPIPPQSDPERAGPYAASRFVYDAAKDVCTCPQGQDLQLIAVRRKSGKDYSIREYRCAVFHDCPVRWHCSRDRHGRRIEISPYHEALQRHREKLRGSGAQEALRQRAGTAEAPFGTIKEAMGFRRFTARGHDAARTQWALVCTALNLQKLYKLWRGQTLAWS
jgi:transposase